MLKRLKFGKDSEKEAVEFLKAKGYNILTCNYRTRFGEIDIIAQETRTICFVEVKARHSQSCGLGEEAVGIRKQRQISKAAWHYLEKNSLLEKDARFDVLSILHINDRPEFTLIKDAFELSPGFTI